MGTANPINTSANGYNAETLPQFPGQANAPQSVVTAPAPTNPGKPAREKPQVKIFRRRFWDVSPNGDAIPALDEDEPRGEVVQKWFGGKVWDVYPNGDAFPVPDESEPEEEVVQPAVSTSTQPQSLVPSTTSYITQTPVNHTITVPASTRPQMPALPPSPPSQPLKLKLDTLQPADFPDNITHLPREPVQQPVRIEAKHLNERTTHHGSFKLNAPRLPTNRPATPSIPTNPAATPLARKQRASDCARPPSESSNSTTNRCRRSPLLEEPIEGETWPDPPTTQKMIAVSDFKLAGSLPRRPSKKVRRDGNKPMICDNAGCSGNHSHDNCKMPRQCKGCGSLDHFWGRCKRRCDLCGTEKHAAELCFTIPVGEDLKIRSGNSNGNRRGSVYEPQTRGPTSEEIDPLNPPGGRLRRSDDRDSRKRPEDRNISPEDKGPWAKPELGSSAHEDTDLRGRRSSGRMPGHDARDREEPWDQGGPYLKSDERFGRLGRHDVHGRKRSADMTRGDSARPVKRTRITREDGP